MPLRSCRSPSRGVTTNPVEQASLSELAAAVEVAADPVTRLRANKALRDATRRVEKEAIESGRALGLSWTELAVPIGISKQALRARYVPMPSSVGNLAPEAGAQADRGQRRTEHPAAAEYEVRTLWPGVGVPLARIVRRPARRAT